MQKDAADDPQLQLDMINACVRLGNVQGNPYDQNIGDPQGAMATLDKALAIAGPLHKTQPNNAAVTREHLNILADAGLVRAKRIKQWTFHQRDETALRKLKTLMLKL